MYPWSPFLPLIPSSPSVAIKGRRGKGDAFKVSCSIMITTHDTISIIIVGNFVELANFCAYTQHNFGIGWRRDFDCDCDFSHLSLYRIHPDNGFFGLSDLVGEECFCHVLWSQFGSQCNMIKLFKSSDDVFPWGSSSWLEPEVEHVNFPTQHSILVVGCLDILKLWYRHSQHYPQCVPIAHFLEFFEQLLNSWKWNICTEKFATYQ